MIDLVAGIGVNAWIAHVQCPEIVPFQAAEIGPAVSRDLPFEHLRGMGISPLAVDLPAAARSLA